ncbi:germin-like protein subfamily 1 member 7 [Quercus suber]|uniref:Germin-like protein n=1 Tax=Quercus suber TaxID=58331 RepID=A0AAW0L0U2_QUESU
MMKVVIVAILALATTLVSAYDPSPLQDFCVAINHTDSAAANKLGSSVNLVNVDKFPGLNTLGISLALIDFTPYGLNPPHTHPRGTELLVVIEGTLLVGFVTSNPNKLFTKVLNKGDIFVFPIGLIHFQFNIGETNALAFSGLSSQNPGLITIANAVFGSNPPINPDVLIKAFQLDKSAGDVFVFPIGLIHFQFNTGETNALAFSGLSSQNPGLITKANVVFGSNPPINPDVLTKAFQLDKSVVDYLQKQF